MSFQALSFGFLALAKVVFPVADAPGEFRLSAPWEIN